MIHYDTSMEEKKKKYVERIRVNKREFCFFLFISSDCMYYKVQDLE